MAGDHSDEQWQVNRTLSECMDTLFETQRWCDIRFRCANQSTASTDKLIQAHKTVLATRSPVFEAMFYGMLADKSSEVELCDTRSEDLKLFLRYLYTDKIGLTESSVSGVMQLAHKYLVQTLFSVCCHFLTTILQSENALLILDIAIFYDLSDLKTRCMKQIDQNAEKILEQDYFLELPLERLEYVLSGDTFNADESKIIEAAFKWAERQCKLKSIEPTGCNVRDVLGSVFKHLRFPTLYVNDFSRLTYKKGYLTFEESEDILRYITGDKSVRTVTYNKFRRPHVLRVKVKPAKDNYLGKITFSPMNRVTTDIKLECRDDVYFIGLIMSSLLKLQKQQLPSGVVPCIAPKSSLTIVVKLKQPGGTDIELHRFITTDVQASKTMNCPLEICLRKSAVVEISLDLVCTGVGFNMKVPIVEEIVGVPQPHECRVGMPGSPSNPIQHVKATFPDDCRIVDTVVFLSPSKRKDDYCMP